MSKIDWIVFSRNRPYQLTAFLRSAKQIGGLDLKRVAVIYHYDPPFLENLVTVQQEIPDPCYVQQQRWIDTLQQMLSLCGETMSFATDDSIFVRPCRWEIGRGILEKNDLVLAFCHRYGLQLNYCYAQDMAIAAPSGFVEEGVFFWHWPSSKPMWNYLGSVDGHQFRTDEVRGWITGSNSPNTLEDRLHGVRKDHRPLGACLPLSCYLTIPANRVQSTHLNRFSGEPADSLNDQYTRGRRPEPERFAGMINTATHEPLDL